MVNPDSLTSRILKAKYFPRCDFLSASLGGNPSFSWRSIWSSRVLLKEGIRWCVGSGEQIRIWEDPWLKGGSTRCPQPHNNAMQRLVFVKDLIMPGTKQWDMEALQENFAPADINSILRVPLLQSVTHDFMQWMYDRRGCYSIKSAYYVCLNKLVYSSHLRAPGNWRTIWQLKVPPRLRVFVWQIARACLPTRDALQRRGINVPDTCLRCAVQNETHWHCFINCSHAVSCWEQTGYAQDVTLWAHQAANMAEFILGMLNHLDMARAQRWVFILWSMWLSRNQLLWEKKEEALSQMIARADACLDNYNRAKLLQVHSNGSQQAGTQQHDHNWKKPSAGRIKCNIDAAFKTNQNLMGVGICLRNAEGSFLKARTICFAFCLEVHEGEALGLLTALRWVRDLGYANVDFELDAKIVVDRFHKPCEDLSGFGAIIKDCRQFLPLFLSNSSVEFARREANVVTHTLARVATFTASSHIFDDVPSCIAELILSEMT